MTNAVIRVGDGRGFIIKEEAVGWRHLVVTAAHCLPSFPPAHAFSYLEQRTYRELLGPLGGDNTVWAECLFADPIADVAVLGSPDNQELSDEADKYDALVDAVEPLEIVPAPEEGRGRLLSLDGQWFECLVRHFGGGLCLFECKQPIVGGMSGSPVRNENGAAIGVVSIGSNAPQFGEGPNPNLARDLPAKFLPSTGGRS